LCWSPAVRYGIQSIREFLDELLAQEAEAAAA
jgi:hypothetical protein